MFILQIVEEHNASNPIGLVEYKAPVYLIYTKERFPPHGIPRYYMAQVSLVPFIGGQSGGH